MDAFCLQKFLPDLAIQFGALWPAPWFKYDDVNGIGHERSIWRNAWSLSLKRNIQLHIKVSVFYEPGIANITRNGFSINDKIIYWNAYFASLICGVGLKYTLNKI